MLKYDVPSQFMFTHGDTDYLIFNEWGDIKAWLLHHDVYTPNFSFENAVVAGYLLTTCVSGDCVKIDTFSGLKKNMWFVNFVW